MKRHLYSEEEINFLKVNSIGKTAKQLTDDFNNVFKTNLSESQIRQTARRYGIKFGETPIRFDDEERQFILERYGNISLNEIVKEFNAVFLNHQITFYGLRSYINKTLNLRLDNPYKFSSFYSLNKVQVGTEHKRYGYVLVKVSDATGKKEDHKDRINWKFKHRILWEKYYGQKLPKGYQVVFLNGDRNDFSKENLKAVPVKYMGKMNVNGWLKSGNAELAKTGFLLCELDDILNNHNN